MFTAGQLGFGTGNLYGGRHRDRSLSLIRTALDSGIRWIDTAPLYGHGTAEGIVGEAIAGRRDELTLVSKVGILPSPITLGYRLHARAASLVEKFLGGGALLPSPSPRHPTFHVFALADVRRSVEQSLKALNTNRLDYLLLHECDPAEALNHALLNTLEDLVAEGKILGFGTATQTDRTREIAASPHADRFSLWQIPADAPLSAALPPLHSGQRIVLHSVLGPRLKNILDRLKTDVSLQELASSLDIDPENPDLGRRLIAHAIRQKAVTAVLFSTQYSDRLRSMAAADSLSTAAAEAGIRFVEEAQAAR